ALAVYVTNENLAGTVAEAYGFDVTQDGLGVRSIDVGDSGSAFGTANGSSLRVLDLLYAVNTRSHGGLVFDIDGDGDATDLQETLARTLASAVFTSINGLGGIQSDGLYDVGVG